MKEKSPIELAIKADLASRGLSLTTAAPMLGMSLQNFQHIFGRTISSMNAKRLHEAFGYDIHFLTTGEGSLFPDQSAPAAPSSSGVVLPSELLQMFNNMTDTIALQQRNIAQLIDHLGATATASAPMKKSSPADWRG